MPYVVVVTLDIKPGRVDEFLPLIRSNAHTSLSFEEGCHRFDIATDPTRPNEVFLYELYEDSASFEAHLASDHFKAFDAAVVDMISEKSVKTYAQVIE